ncbi:glyoxalase/bleomycin resistance protein/dioxygenase [Paraglaciecola psychrophila 170]|uniref:Glyoxalase/bleomycin resistance protein/dioxygenase n=2 Tax=Paraglaciecola TaxID=1621534 RepID=K6ZXD9_9ALTE|nr:glyoxalase/bleomycin resistance protein/dioxygenase [Paraglaciecola psychrophila 170]GAC40571.1 probable dioxygenase [Paraglaciecola psychrophila 170]
MMLTPFHLAIPVTDLEQAKAFYGGLLGCERGRRSDDWIDWNFFGHQLVTHLVTEMPSFPKHNQVDNYAVPIPHFGVVLNWSDWQALAIKLSTARIDFIIEPYIRFEGQAGEQATMFFMDPCGNALEFKAFQDIHQLFAS